MHLVTDTERASKYCIRPKVKWNSVFLSLAARLISAFNFRPLIFRLLARDYPADFLVGKQTCRDQVCFYFSIQTLDNRLSELTMTGTFMVGLSRLTDYSSTCAGARCRPQSTARPKTKHPIYSAHFSAETDNVSAQSGVPSRRSWE